MKFKPAPFIIALLFLATHGNFVAAADERAKQLPGTDYTTEERNSYIGEASRAVAGRVFGVGGSAANDIKYHEFEFTARTPRNAMIRSTLVPGWGQYFNRQQIKGSIFFLCTVGSAIAGARLYSESRDSYREYENKGAKSDSSYDDYVNERDQAYIFGGAAVILWVWNIFDARKNAYSSLYSKNNGAEFAFSDDGAGIRLKTSF